MTFGFLMDDFFKRLLNIKALVSNNFTLAILKKHIMKSHTVFRIVYLLTK